MITCQLVVFSVEPQVLNHLHQCVQLATCTTVSQFKQKFKDNYVLLHFQ